MKIFAAIILALFAATTSFALRVYIAVEKDIRIPKNVGGYWVPINVDTTTTIIKNKEDLRSTKHMPTCTGTGEFKCFITIPDANIDFKIPGLD